MSIAHPLAATPRPSLPLVPPAEVSSTPACKAIHKLCIFGGTGGQFSGELQTLLRGRLQVVSLIMLFPVAVFLMRNLMSPADDNKLVAVVVLQAISFILNAAFAGLLWSRFTFSLKTLRMIELALFGLFAVYFGWMQFEFAYFNLLGDLANPSRQRDALRLLSFGIAVRWFFLIIVYGVFIPNTWRRCAWVVGLTASLPILITALTDLAMGRFGGDHLSSLFDGAALLVTACLIAVFGSYRLHALQTQAFEAEQLGQYKLKRRIGSGGMGEVYLAEHVLLRRPCAVKLIRPEQAGNAQNLERFEREVRAMATLTHWNTVEIFDYGHTEDGTFYYVMEYLPGMNLETLVTNYGPLPPARALHLLRQVCGALWEAHRVGLLHRDVKPSNIIVGERGGLHDVAKLLDFGLVQGTGLSGATNRITMQGTIVGSPPYISPEQALGKKVIDARSDIYSVGALAYCLLTGHPPFPRETAMEMLLAHAYEEARPLVEVKPDVPFDLAAVVLRCLRKKPEERFADVKTLETALAACEAAGSWTEDMAAAWWRERPNAAEETQEMSQPTVLIPT